MRKKFKDAVKQVFKEHKDTISKLEESDKKAIKHDSGKSQLSLINRASLDYEARAMAYGKNKYGRNNYKNGMEWTRLLDAALRHITAFSNGEDFDSESGESHIGHAKACLGMLAFYIENKKGIDDR